LNIVITTDYYPPHIGGVETVTFELAHELSNMDHRVSVITLSNDNVAENSGHLKIYKAKSHEFTRVLGIQSAFSSETGRLIRKVCRKESADILHANNLFYSTTIAASASKRSLKLPLVTTLHIGSTSHLEGPVGILTRFYARTIGRWILDRSDHIVAVSDAIRAYLRALSVPSSKISVIPNGVDLHINTPNFSHRNKELRIAFVGRLISNKGPQYFVEAAPIILHEFPSAKFLIIGEGPLLSALHSRVQKLRVKDRFQFLGSVPKLSTFLRNCDVYVRPSLTEGMPLTVLEAMACGIPTVATRIEGVTEILTHGDTGFLVEPRNVDQLAFYISKLIGDPELRSRMGKRARESVENHNNWKTVAVQTSRVYESVLGS
jgi:glycosyltransferase involved in cell wall biosynthesis